MPIFSSFFRRAWSVTFVSDYPLAESVQRLREASFPPGFDAESTESLMGSVEQASVSLEHSLPWPNVRELRLRFIGSFQMEDSRVVLRGDFVENTLPYFFNASSLLFRPNIGKEADWISAAIRQALNRPASGSVPNNLPNPTNPV